MKQSIDLFIDNKKKNNNYEIAKLEFIKSLYPDITVNKNGDTYSSKLVNNDCNKCQYQGYLYFSREIDFIFDNKIIKITIQSKPYSISFVNYHYAKDCKFEKVHIIDIGKKLKFNQEMINLAYKFVAQYIKDYNKYAPIYIDDNKLKNLLVMI